MTDTRHPGLIAPDNAPRLADLNDDSAPYPSQITVFCDECGDEVTADYLVPADTTSADRLEIARSHMRAKLGWVCDENGDFCTSCVKTRAAAPYETETDQPECPDCGNGCGGHAPETYHVGCGENVTDCTCPNRPAPAGRSLIFGEINAERFRQDAKWGKQHREDGTGGPVMRDEADRMRTACNWLAEHGGADWRAVLLEEVYEALAEEDQAKLRAELVQICAVSCAWIEDIDSRKAE